MTVIGPITIGTEPKAHLPGKRYLITKNSVAEMDYITETSEACMRKAMHKSSL